VDLPVAIEKTADGRYCARSGELLALVAEGDSRDEALINLNRALHERLASGTELTTVSVESPGDDTWETSAESLKGHPLLEEWKQAMADYRRQLDAELDGS
jgi:predicted RNase H-like HicB family nuclease